MSVQTKLEELVNSLEFLLVDCQGMDFDEAKTELFVDAAINNVDQAISYLQNAIESSTE